MLKVLKIFKTAQNISKLLKMPKIDKNGSKLLKIAQNA